jgi:hypothetical protein
MHAGAQDLFRRLHRRIFQLLGGEVGLHHGRLRVIVTMIAECRAQFRGFENSPGLNGWSFARKAKSMFRHRSLILARS